MDYRALDITVISASGLKNVNIFMKMGVYVVVSLISGNSTITQKTHVSNGHKNPRWNRRMKFSIIESDIQNANLIFNLHSRRVLGDKIIGEVSIPVHELIENMSRSEIDEHVVEYLVRSIRGKSRGTLTFSHNFKVTNSQKKNNSNNMSGQVLVNTIYPPGNVYDVHPQGVACYSNTPYPLVQGCTAYPGEPQYGGG